MSITLIFNGGFFVVPGTGQSRKATAHLACPKRVTINGEAENDLAKELIALILSSQWIDVKDGLPTVTEDTHYFTLHENNHMSVCTLIYM